MQLAGRESLIFIYLLVQHCTIDDLMLFKTEISKKSCYNHYIKLYLMANLIVYYTNIIADSTTTYLTINVHYLKREMHICVFQALPSYTIMLALCTSCNIL